MEFEEFSGKTVDEALMNAALKLQTVSDEIEYEVVEEGSNGVLGFGRKPAKIKARKKLPAEKVNENKANESSVVNEEVEVKEEKDQVNETIDEDTVKKITKEFLEKVFGAMNLEVTIDMRYSEDSRTLDVDLNGDEMGLLIGKRGQTIDSLQYLLSLVINRESKDYIRVKLDTENYRERRKETLEELAKNIAYKVKRTKRQVSLEPMNPYERRIIHSALQNDKYVTTRSEGEEPYRHIIVFLKNK